jgi:hypothetical protein
LSRKVKSRHSLELIYLLTEIKTWLTLVMEAEAEAEEEENNNNNNNNDYL